MKAMKLAAVLFSLASLGAAWAQTGAPVPQPASISEEQRQAVKELLAVMNFKKTMSQMAMAMSQSMPQVMDNMIESVIKAHPEMSEQQKDRMRGSVKDARATMTQSVVEIYNDPVIVADLENIMGTAYAKRFSASEILKITAFYKSPEGVKMLNTMPDVMQEAMPQIMRSMSPRMMAMVEKMSKDITAKVLADQTAGEAKKP